MKINVFGFRDFYFVIVNVLPLRSLLISVDLVKDDVQLQHLKVLSQKFDTKQF